MPNWFWFLAGIYMTSKGCLLSIGAFSGWIPEITVQMSWACVICTFFCLYGTMIAFDKMMGR